MIINPTSSPFCSNLILCIINSIFKFATMVNSSDPAYEQVKGFESGRNPFCGGGFINRIFFCDFPYCIQESCEGMQCIFRITNYQLHRQFQETSVDLLHKRTLGTYPNSIIHLVNGAALLILMPALQLQKSFTPTTTASNISTLNCPHQKERQL